MGGDAECVALWVQDQPEEVKPPSACDTSKAGRSYPVPEDNGDPGSVNPAAPELIHKRKVPAEQAPPVVVPPRPPFSNHSPSTSWASHEHLEKSHSQTPDT